MGRFPQNPAIFSADTFEPVRGLERSSDAGNTSRPGRGRDQKETLTFVKNPIRSKVLHLKIKFDFN